MTCTENPSGGATRKSASLLIMALPLVTYSNQLISVTPASASLAQGSQEAGYGQEAAGRDLCSCLDGQADNNEPAA